MRKLSLSFGAMAIAVGLTLSGAPGATAASPSSTSPVALHATTTVDRPNRPESPPPSCWQNFSMTRYGEEVRIAGVDLGPGNKLVWPSDQYGTDYGAYNATTYTNFVIDTHRTEQQNISVSVTDVDNTTTLCEATFFV